MKNKFNKEKPQLKKETKPVFYFNSYKQLKPTFTKTFEITTPLIKELISFGAFIGDWHKWTHTSQRNFISAYKNNYSFYDIRISIRLFTKAIRFLKLCRNSRRRVVFVGNPPALEEETIAIFKNIKKKFFANDTWPPGFFSKNPKNCKCVLVIYDIKLNIIAYREAVNANIPVVGFATPSCDIGAVDYPILLNLQNAGLWYAKFWKIFYIMKIKNFYKIKLKKNDTKFR